MKEFYQLPEAAQLAIVIVASFAILVFIALIVTAVWLNITIKRIDEETEELRFRNAIITRKLRDNE